ncbi:MAG: Translation initiation factor 6 [Methanosaeta sp. PtaB.Bin039]|nr:MAG: Translation initiation factor 6 [Methanosaeta sp. PtaB.Bin039]OPY45481.1 MAG: Translation initiation factor 6 [Methanosaeta sp. PtaU1.Bin028]HOT07153.1 translation initiation factor IF-6 [Methanotrichaceae archaeon]HQF16874.1 translation initiation factor IF-6 [Methanotrichaceae archaeon]HQI91440.1 translation initiation factor IF-6 [Methanotrichaceae archaeon]
MTDRRTQIAGNSLLGVFGRSTEALVLVPPETGEKSRQALELGLNVPVRSVFMAGSSVLGSLIGGNSNGFVVTSYASDDEIRALEASGRVSRLPGKISAAGNVILANDTAALVHPGLTSRAVEQISETLGVDVRKGTIGGLRTVGMAAVATNRGILAHPRISEAEIAVLENLFSLPVDVGTVNFGSPLVGSGILANSHGYMAGAKTTGPELGRIESALGFLA